MGRGWRGLRPFDSRHVSEDELLLHLDGALEGRREEAVARHLRECWTCRSQDERLRDAIAAFMEERRDALRRQGELPGDPPRFAARLARASATPVAARQAASRPRFLARRLAWIPAAAALAAFGAWAPIRDYVRSAATPAISIPAPPRPPVPRPAESAFRLPLPVHPVARSLPRANGVDRPMPAVTAGSTAMDLDAAELAAHLAIHRLGLCRWQAIEVLREPSRSIRITGVAESAAKAAQLRAAVAGVAPVDFEVVSPPDDLPAIPRDRGNGVRFEPRPPPLQKMLEERFLRQSPADVAVRSIAEFCGRATLLAATASSEAQALNAFAAAFPGPRLERLAAADRARAAGIAREHLRELEQSMAHLQALLDRLDDVPEAVPPPPALPAAWEEWSRAAARQAARIDWLVGGLFAGLDLRGLAAADAWAELRQSQARSLALLRAAETTLRDQAVAFEPASPRR